MISIDQWDDLVFPDNVSLQRTVNDVLENFRQAKETISKIQIRDEISNSSTKLFDEFDIEILNNAFNDRSDVIDKDGKLTSSQMANLMSQDLICW
ncbi:23726_t:CDS:2 [Entrophospora sp. SA101]|nr:23726_t:CDS:2 [Entrophospora sp. SA101]CAJ0911938.1 18218_t:CDS:2 [Entrophospora sp. SA101]